MTIVLDSTMRETLMKAEAQRILAEGKRRNLHLRLLGAIAFQVHCPKYSFLSAKLSRVLSDLDFAAYSKERRATELMMREFGYADQPMITALFGDRRLIFDNRSNGMHVDIFFDKLEMNHTIPFTDRLDLDEMTIPLVDMLLEKMQIVQINEKDIIDTIMLLREHGVNGDSPEAVDVQYLARLLSNDWGFYHTVTTNLQKIQDTLSKYAELSAEDRNDIIEKIQKVLKAVEDHPKTLSWKLRAKVGTKNKWYRDVEEVNR